MRPLVHKEPHWMPVDSHFDGEIVRRARLYRIPWHGIVMRVYQRLVQIQHQGFSLHQAEAMAGYR